MLGFSLILLVVLAWIVLFRVARELGARGYFDPDWRICWMLASVGFGSILTMIVEISSLAQSLNRTTLALLWMGVDLGLFMIAAHLTRGRSAGLLPGKARSVGAVLKSQISKLKVSGWPLDAKCCFGASAVIALFLLLIGLLTPTSNGDSLSYHLPRMFHWIQQGSVDHFPTDDTRQLEFGPWSSFLMTNLFLLWGGDRLLNLVQWFAMISSVIVLTWMLEQLGRFAGGYETSPAAPLQEAERGAARRATAFTCLLAVTLPIGMVESITTQNDYTTAFWLLCLFAFAFMLSKNPTSIFYVTGAGLACGLGVLTKATTYIYAAPLILAGGAWWFWQVGRRPSPVSALAESDQFPNGEAAPSPGGIFSGTGQQRCGCRRIQLSLFFVVAFFGLNAPHLLRNYALFGSPLGSSQIVSVERNQRLSPAVAASNMIRNLALHANSGIPTLTEFLNFGLGALHQLTGKDLNDPATTYEHCSFRFVQSFEVYDSLASCTVHLMLIGVAVGLALLSPKRNLKLLGYSGLILASFALFCFLLKWQPWHTRIHLAWFLLFIPVVVLVICERLPRPAVALFSFALLAFDGMTLSQNASRPVFDPRFRQMSRERQYFALHEKDLAEPMARLADRIVASKCQAVGLKAGFCGIEYPLWIMLRNRGFHGRVDRCDVEHVSRSIQTTARNPDVIVTVLQPAPEALAKMHLHPEKFGRLNVLWSEHSYYAFASGRSEKSH